MLPKVNLFSKHRLSTMCYKINWIHVYIRYEQLDFPYFYFYKLALGICNYLCYTIINIILYSDDNFPLPKYKN